jgi:putative endonuclease
MRALNVSRPVSQWRDPRHRRGIDGEIAASRHLESLGFQIEAHRFRFGHHDIDLIARRGTLVVFAEVKARWSRSFGQAVEAIGWRKRRDLATVAMVWISRFGRAGDRYRFDLITASYEEGGFPQIDHLEGAFVHMEK